MAHLSEDQLFRIIREFNLLLQGGASEAEALSRIKVKSSDPLTISFLGDLVSRMGNGQSLSEALREGEVQLPDDFVTWVEIGEDTGKLPELLQHYGKYFTQKLTNRYKTRKVLFYGMLTGLLAGIILIIMTVISWGFGDTQIFQEMDIALPGLVILLLQARYWAILPALMLLIMPICYFGKIITGKGLVFSLARKVPLLRPVVMWFFKHEHYSFLTQTADYFSILLKLEVPVPEITKSLNQRLSFMGYNSLFVCIEKAMEEGRNLSEAFMGNSGMDWLFPELWTTFVKISEQRDCTQKVFKNLQILYSQRTQNRFELLFNSIRPLILWINGSLIFTALLLLISSLLLPIPFTLSFMCRNFYQSFGLEGAVAVLNMIAGTISLGLTAEVLGVLGFWHRKPERRKYFLFAFKQLLGHGYSVTESMKIIGSTSRYFKRRLKHLILDLEIDSDPVGVSLWASNPGILPDNIWEIVIAGFEAQNPQESIDIAMEALETGSLRTPEIKGHFAYIMLLVTFIICIGVPLWMVNLKRMSFMFGEIGADDFPTKEVINTIEIALSILFLAFILFGVIVFTVYIARVSRRNESYSLWREKVVMLVPFWGRVFRRQLGAAFFSSIYIMLKQGIPEKEIIDTIQGSTRSSWLKRQCKIIQKWVEEGYSFPEALEKTFENKSMNLPFHAISKSLKGETFLTAMQNYSLIVKNENERSLIRIGQILVPAAVLVIGAGVGFMVISLFYPLISMMRNLMLW